MSENSSLAYRFNVSGMDCAACVAKIEKAVGRISGASQVKVGMQSQTLTVNLEGPESIVEVATAVKKLGYGIMQEVSKTSSDNQVNHSDDDGQDHSDHGGPIVGHWWKSQRGLFVLLTGFMIGLAYVTQYALPSISYWVFLLAAAVGTFPVARRALSALMAGLLFTIEMLMTIAVVGAVIINATEEAALVVFLFAVGELLEGIAAGRARSGIKALAQIAPKTAMVETPNGLVETPIEKIPVGTNIVVRPGDRVPADGTIISGTSSVDESAITGESMPRNKEKGDMVLAGSINNEAVLRVRVEKPAEDTVIARVVKLVEEAAWQARTTGGH